MQTLSLAHPPQYFMKTIILFGSPCTFKAYVYHDYGDRNIPCLVMCLLQDR